MYQLVLRHAFTGHDSSLTYGPNTLCVYLAIGQFNMSKRPIQFSSKSFITVTYVLLSYIH